MDTTRLSAYLRPDLLVLDDFGLRPLRAQEPEDFYQVIGEGHERKSILVTSNRDDGEWPETFGENPLLASAGLDRFAHQAHLVTITGASYRAQQRPRKLEEAAQKEKRTGEGQSSRSAQQHWQPIARKLIATFRRTLT